MAPAGVLLACLYGGLTLGGLRAPWAWTAFSVVIWTVLLRSPRLSPAPFRAWAPWLAWAAVSAACSDQPLKCVYTVSRWAGVLAYFGLVRSLWGDKERALWFKALCAAGLVLGAAGLWTGWAALIREATGEDMTGLLPPYYNYTAFVEAAMTGAVLFALGRREGPPPGIPRRALWALLSFGLIYLLLARSRGGLLAVAAAGLLMLYRQRQGRLLLRASLIALAAGFLITAAVASLRLGSAGYLLKLDRARSFKRPQLWATALKVARDHPILGEGPGDFGQGFLRHNFASHYGAVNYQFSSQFAHSEPLQLAAETGWIGLGLFLLAWLATLKVPEPSAAAWTEEAALGAFAAMAAHCLIDNMLQLPALAMLFFSAAACAQPKEEPAARAAFPARAAACAGLLLSLSAWIPDRLAASYAARADAEKDPAQRLELARKSVAIFPADASLRLDLSRAYLTSAPPRFGEALAELERASALNPTNAVTLLKRAELLRLRGDWPRVLGLAQEAARLEPAFLQARLLRAEAWALGGDKKAARRELAEVSRLRAELAAAQYTRGYDLAIASFDPSRFERVRRLAE